MLVSIKDIKFSPGRRGVETKDIQELAKSISQVGLLNPITITPDHTLIESVTYFCAAKKSKRQNVVSIFQSLPRKIQQKSLGTRTMERLP